MADLNTALPALLQSYDEAMRAEAERLAEDMAIVTLDVEPESLEAEVLLDSTTAHVRWEMLDGRWQGRCELDDPELRRLACCLALVGLQRLNHEPVHEDVASVSIAVESMQGSLERLHGRKLTLDEEAYLLKIEKRFERYNKTGDLFDSDVVRLHPKWTIENAEPLELWADAPRTTTEFWNYIALALSERSLPTPHFLRPVTDLAETRNKLKAWRQSRTVPQWVQRIRRFAGVDEQPVPVGALVDCRLLLTTNDARLQVQSAEGGPFQTIRSAQVESLLQTHRAVRGSLPAEADLLLVACFLQMEQIGSDGFKLDDEAHAAWLSSLFAQPALRSRLVTRDEVPYEMSTEALSWAAEDSEDETAIRLKLITPDGAPAPLPLRVLPGTQTLYLSSDNLRPGPLWFGEENMLEAPAEIPMLALRSSDGLAFLERLGAALPKSLAERVLNESLKVEIKAECAAAASGASTQYAHLTITASSPDGRYEEEFQDGKWVAVKDEKRHDGMIVRRDRSSLEAVPALVDELKTTFDRDLGAHRTRMTRAFPEKFHQWALSIPEAVKLELDSELGSIMADPLIARVKLEARQNTSIDWFDLRVIFEIEGVDLKAAEIRKLLAARGGFVKLADGSWRRVKLELSEEQQAMVDEFGIDLSDPNDEAHRVHWRHLLGDKTAALLSAKAWEELQQRLSAVELREKPDVPKTLNLQLRPYQVDGYHFLCYLTENRFGGILADDMGLGKTVQTIAWMLWLRERSTAASPPPALVVCPKSVLDVWAVELRKAAPELRLQVLHDKDQLDISNGGQSLDVLVLNYAQLRSCIEPLKSIHWLATILDEGQQIKNPDSKASKAARELQAENRLILSGTPMENRLLDLWSLMSFATPGALGDRSYFHKHFDRRKDERATQRLSARLRPFILRRTKGQVARELPARTEENILCEMSDTQKKMYQDQLAQAQQMMLSTAGGDVLRKNRFAILQALTRLRQICCHPALLDPTATAADSAKMTAALELMEQLHEEGHKVLFFSQFVSMLKLVRDKLDEMKLPYHWLTGASENRSQIVKDFQEDTNASVFLISLKAGGSGLNLTAASYVILYDPWWNPAVENQAIDRAHRIGQTQPVMAYRLIAKDTIEEKIMTLQQHKKMLSNDILGEESFAQNLGQNDFEFLLGMERSLTQQEPED